MEETRTHLQTAVDTLTPQFKALRTVMSALKTAVRLAENDTPDALPMQKALVKLEAAAAEVESDELQTAVNAFASDTRQALDNLAFDFAKDLRDAFTARGETVEGRPPTLTINQLTLTIDMATRKGQWLYGKDPLTRPIPLSINGILKAYDQQAKRILNRQLDKPAEFLAELHTAWQNCINKRGRRPREGRISITEVYSQLIMNRQNGRFWNNPSCKTFKDYERELFVRDLVLLRQNGLTNLVADGENHPLKLGIATKSQAESTNKSIWLPTSALGGDYYGDITFDA